MLRDALLSLALSMPHKRYSRKTYVLAALAGFAVGCAPAAIRLLDAAFPH